MKLPKLPHWLPAAIVALGIALGGCALLIGGL